MPPKGRQERRKVLNTPAPCNTDTPHPRAFPAAAANRRKRSQGISRRKHNVDPASSWRIKREFRLSARQTNSFFSLSLFLSFLPSFVLRLRNYIPRALSAPRSSAIIAERSYSRASCTSVHIYYGRCFTLHTIGVSHLFSPLHLADPPCKILRRRMAR